MYFYQIQNYKCRNFIPIYNLTPIMKTIFNILKICPVTVFISGKTWQYVMHCICHFPSVVTRIL